MRDVTEVAETRAEIWSYIARVPEADLGGAAIIPDAVDFIYRNGDCEHDHVLVRTDRPATYLIVVVDLVARTIFGHRLMDFEYEFGRLNAH